MGGIWGLGSWGAKGYGGQRGWGEKVVWEASGSAVEKARS